MNQQTLPPPTGIDAPGLVVQLRRAQDGPVIARERVLRGDLADVVGEFWRDCILGRGILERCPDDLLVEAIPGKDGAARYGGFAVVGAPTAAALPLPRLNFSALALERVARRAEERLAAAGTLAAKDKYFYEIDFEAAPAAETAAGAGLDFEGTLERRPLYLLRVPLAPLLARARVEGSDPAGLFPVFHIEAGLARAEEFSRKGVSSNPEFESGGVLVGVLCSCPESGALFLVITDVFPVTDAEASPVSLEYSGESWSRIQAVIRARQQSEPAIELAGQAHGHNVLPGGGQTCAECLTREVCTLHNVFASPADHAWTRAVFPGAPWCLCHIFGLSARGDRLQGLFTFHDGRLMQRGFHVLPDFDPGGHPVVAVPR